VTCGRTQEFLAKAKVQEAEIVDARKRKLALKDAVALLEGMDTLVAAKGKKVERVDLRKGRPDAATLERLMLGPTGNLRAPTLKVGRTVLVGFDEEIYRQVLR
jgi:arsenate reductase-like glutaredoxin family protein